MPETPAEPPVDLSGRTLGDFAVLRKLGSGGMGQVYLARQISLKRDVALKLLRNDLTNQDNALKRFQAEAEAVARISHPNIVQVYAIGEHDGLRFMALEYVSGRNLRDYLARKGPPDLPVALAILRQVAQALAKANELGIVHRDIKPENILLTKRVEVKVTDFGLSRLTTGDAVPLNLTQSGVTLGTPLYMAPEQVQGKGTDHRSDLYSFGVTAYHLLAGQPPFSGATAYDVAMKHVTDQPESLAVLRPDLPADLIALVHKLMAKNPEDRYASAKDVLRDLGKIAKGVALGLPTPAATNTTIPDFAAMTQMGPVAAATTLQMPVAPSPWSARILGLLALAAIFAAGWWLFDRLHPKSKPSAAPVIAGLPDLQFDESLQPQRTKERELQALLDNRATGAAEYIKASIELGLYYVKERRFDAAKKVFEELEKDRPDARGLGKGLLGPPPSLLAAKFGQAIVLAQQDKVEESLAAFTAATNTAARAYPQLHKFLIDQPDLSQAIAEALFRNQENLKGKKLPAQLEWLRTPGGIIRGRDTKS